MEEKDWERERLRMMADAKPMPGRNPFVQKRRKQLYTRLPARTVVQEDRPALMKSSNN